MPFIYPHRNSNIEGKILVIPVVAAANVAQLAVDILIASLSLRRVASIDAKYFIPVVGAREDGELGITTPCELFTTDNVKLAVIQQRSPVLKARKQEFVDSLFGYIKTSGASAVLFLSGADVSHRSDSQMLTPTYKIQPEGIPLLASSPLRNLNSLPIPTYTASVDQHSLAGGDNLPLIPFIPGGGLTRRLLSSLPQGWQISTAAILQFVLEGDNRADAQLLVAVVVKVLELDSTVTEWKHPISWQQGLFGTPQEQTLYG